MSEEKFTMLEADKLVAEWREIAKRGRLEDVFYLQQLVPLAVGYLEAQAEILLRRSNFPSVVDHGEAAKVSFQEAVGLIGKGIEHLAECWHAYAASSS